MFKTISSWATTHIISAKCVKLASKGQIHDLVKGSVAYKKIYSLFH